MPRTRWVLVSPGGLALLPAVLLGVQPLKDRTLRRAAARGQTAAATVRAEERT